MDADVVLAIMNIVLAGMFGAVIGSFTNVCIYRIPEHRTVVKGHSMCMTCGHELGALDLVPIFSWLFLGGKDAEDYHFDEMYDDGVMALCGWDKVGDLSDCPDKESVDKRRQSVSEYRSNTENLTGMLHAMANEINEGDIVLAKYSKSDIVGMGIVTGDYRYDDESVYGKHCRDISWTHKGTWHCASILKEFGKDGFPVKALTNVTKLKYIPMILQMIEGEKTEDNKYFSQIIEKGLPQISADQLPTLF